MPLSLYVSCGISGPTLISTEVLPVFHEIDTAGVFCCLQKTIITPDIFVVKARLPDHLISFYQALPDNENILVLALTLAEEGGPVRPLQPLVDGLER